MRKALCLFCLVAAFASAGIAGTAPGITAQEAARIADEYLKERGLLTSTHIVSISMEQASLLNRTQHWLVKWDAPLTVEGMKKKEIGLKVTFEGKVTRLVE